MGLSLVEAGIGAVAVELAGVGVLVYRDLRKTRSNNDILTGRDEVESDDGLVGRVDENEQRSESNARTIAVMRNS